MGASWEETAETLTRQALAAAEEGRWDAVERHYRRRMELFRSREIPPVLASRLHSVDRHIYEKLRVAALATKCLLRDVSSKQQRLDQFALTMDVSAIAPRVSRRM